MNREDNVFLLTLIDFLLQIIFFGVFVYALYMSTHIPDEARNNAIAKLLAHFGVSNIVVLTDELTKMAPADTLRNAVKDMQKIGGKEKLNALIALAEKSGGISEIETRLEKLRRLEEGAGKPPCVFDVKDGKKIARPIARVVATEERITFETNTADLIEVLGMLGLKFEEVRSLSLAEFEVKFGALRSRRQDCRYSLTFVETTRFVEPRDVVMKTFNMWPPIKKLASVHN